MIVSRIGFAGDTLFSVAIPYEPVPLPAERFDPVHPETGEPRTEWWVLDPEGAPLARTLTPSGVTVRAISSDAVWGVERDELDVEYIVRYRLVKGG